MIKKLTIALGLLATTALPAMAHAPKPITGLLTPESVVQAKDGAIYVSEINGFGKDGDGQIRVIKNGKPEVLVQGLDDPKGLAIIGDNLFIADKTKILKVNLKAKPAVAETFVTADRFAHPPQFLNDLEADPQGNLYVSDSGDILGTGKGGAIYKITPQNEVILLIDGAQDARVLAPNGLLVDSTGNTLIYVDFTSGVLYQYDQKTKTLSDIAQGFGGGDGVVYASNGLIYVSDWKAGRVFSLDAKDNARVLKAGYQSAADIAISQDEHFLMVPDMKAGVLDFIDLK